MNPVTSHHHDTAPSGPSGYWVGVAIVLMIVAFFLWTEHRAHLLGVLPYLFLLACPAMHLFMHRGHRNHGGHHDS